MTFIIRKIVALNTFYGFNDFMKQQRLLKFFDYVDNLMVFLTSFSFYLLDFILSCLLPQLASRIMLYHILPSFLYPTDIVFFKPTRFSQSTVGSSNRLSFIIGFSPFIARTVNWREYSSTQLTQYQFVSLALPDTCQRTYILWHIVCQCIVFLKLRMPFYLFQSLLHTSVAFSPSLQNPNHKFLPFFRKDRFFSVEFAVFSY